MVQPCPMTAPPRFLESILRPLLPAAELAEGILAASDLLGRAHAVHPESWLSDEDFVEHAVRHASTDAKTCATLRMLHAADLFLALACARGVPAALKVFEEEHFKNVGDFIARIDSS